MERKHISEQEHKLVLLFALEQLGPITRMQLLQFLVEMDLMNYFTMQFNLADLEEQGYVTERSHPLDALLCVTKEGSRVLTSFLQRIPASRRSHIQERGKAWRQQFRREQQNLAEAFPLKDGGLCLRLRLLEEHSALMDLLLTLPEQESLTCLHQRWQQAAMTVYGLLSAKLLAGYEEGCSYCGQTLPSCAALQKVHEAEWLLTLTDREENPSLTLLLPLPTREMACYSANQWPAFAEEFRQKVVQALLQEPRG